MGGERWKKRNGVEKNLVGPQKFFPFHFRKKSSRKRLVENFVLPLVYPMRLNIGKIQTLLRPFWSEINKVLCGFWNRALNVFLLLKFLKLWYNKTQFFLSFSFLSFFIHLNINNKKKFLLIFYPLSFFFLFSFLSFFLFI